MGCLLSHLPVSKTPGCRGSVSPGGRNALRTRCDLQRQQLDKEAEFLCRVGVLGWWFSWGGVLAAAKWKVSLAVFGVLEMADGGLRMSLKHSVRLASRS